MTSDENVSKAHVRRLLIYWGIAAWLYFLAVCTIWIQVGVGIVSTPVAVALSAVIFSGTAPGYFIIRFLPNWRAHTAWIAAAQGIHGIVCIALSYAALGPMRGVALLPLPVLFLLCSFSVSRKALVLLAVFSVAALGGSVIWLLNTQSSNPGFFANVTYLLAATNVVAVAVYLAEQFNALRRRLKTQKGELALALANLETLAYRDELTKLPNRRFMQNLLVTEERRHARDDSPLSVALLDIDYFKRVNDKFGHLVGDETLCKFATLLSGTLRTGDVLARWGGEEFLLLLPKTDLDTAVAVVERLQGCVNEHNLQIGDELLRITFSAGLAVVWPGGSSSQAVNFADRAMFDAKAAGRNAIRRFAGNAT